MSGTLKKVRFKVAWGDYRVGDEITPDGMLRSELLQAGYVDLVDLPVAPVLQTSADVLELAPPTDSGAPRRGNRARA